jgi:hypothetical protein
MQRGAPLAPLIPTTSRFGDLDCIFVFRVRRGMAGQHVVTSIPPLGVSSDFVRGFVGSFQQAYATLFLTRR